MAVNKPFIIPDTEKLETAKTFKTEGNECHKNKDYKGAIRKYHRALLQLKGIGQSNSSGLGAFMSERDLQQMGYAQHVPESVRIEVTRLTADCYNNLAGKNITTTWLVRMFRSGHNLLTMASSIAPRKLKANKVLQSGSIINNAREYLIRNHAISLLLLDFVS